MKKITFTAKPSNGTQIYRLRVDDVGIQMNNHVGSKMLQEGESHILQYYMIGTSGGKLNIEGKDVAGKMVVEVKEAKIPTGTTRHAYPVKFDL